MHSRVSRGVIASARLRGGFRRCRRRALEDALKEVLGRAKTESAFEVHLCKRGLRTIYQVGEFAGTRQGAVQG